MKNVEFYEVKDAKKTIISFAFNIEYKREDSMKYNLMKRMIFNYSNNYRTLKEYNIKKDSLYIMGQNDRLFMDVDSSVFCINYTIPKSDILNDFKLEDTIKFIHDVLFDPYANNLEFDLNAFNDEINYLKENEKNYPHSIGEYVKDTFLDFVDEDKKTLIHYDEYLDLLNNITSKDTYEYYLKNIKNNKYIIRVFGSIDDKDNVLSCLNNYFNSENIHSNELKGSLFLPFLDYKEKEIDIDYNQSVLNLNYQFKDLKSEDKIKLEMLYFFLNSRENDLLYTELRYKNNLIYQANINNSMYYGLMIFTIFFNYELLDKIYESIDNVFNYLKIEENYNLCKSRLIKAIEYDMLDAEDNPFNVFRNVLLKNYYPYDILTEKIKSIESITFTEFKEFLDRMVLTRKLIMKSGVSND